jgi:hypothetical protein
MLNNTFIHRMREGGEAGNGGAAASRAGESGREPTRQGVGVSACLEAAGRAARLPTRVERARRLLPSSKCELIGHGCPVFYVPQRIPLTSDKLMPSLKDLEALVLERRRLLEEAEAALLAERSREPAPGDFVRSTLTNFYGRVTRVIPRAGAKPWLEITPYLTPTLPGRSTMDLYDAWEFIEGPADGELGTTSFNAVPNLTEVIVSFDTNLRLVPRS